MPAAASTRRDRSPRPGRPCRRPASSASSLATSRPSESMPDPAASEEPQYLYLTTRGRKTGRPREIEIWFTRRGRCFYLVSERRLRAHWVQNLLEEPRARGARGQRARVGPRHPGALEEEVRLG